MKKNLKRTLKGAYVLKMLKMTLRLLASLICVPKMLQNLAPTSMSKSHRKHKNNSEAYIRLENEKSSLCQKGSASVVYSGLVAGYFKLNFIIPLDIQHLTLCDTLL